MDNELMEVTGSEAIEEVSETEERKFPDVSEVAVFGAAVVGVATLSCLAWQHVIVPLGRGLRRGFCAIRDAYKTAKIETESEPVSEDDVTEVEEN